MDGLLNKLKHVAMSIFILVFIATSVLAFETMTVNATSKTQSEAVNWVCARGNEGWNVDIDNYAGCQCVDLIVAYYKYLGVTSPGGNAKDYTWNNLPSGWTRVYSNPKAGDIVVWGAGAQMGWYPLETSYANGTNGHIGVIHRVNSSGTISTIETNASQGSKAAYYERYTNNVACYIRPNWSNAVSIGDSTIYVTKGDSATATTWSWTKASNAKIYNLRIKKYNGSEYVTYTDIWNLTGTSYSIVLPAGDYYAYVDACNGDACKRSSNSAYCTIKYWYANKTTNNVGDDFYARMVLSHTGMAPGVNASTKNIENVSYSSKTDANYLSQYWHFVRNSDGSYRILNAYYDGRPLEANGTSSGSNVKLGSSYTGSNAQHWYVYGAANGQYIIRNKASEFVLNVHNAYSAAGTNLQIWKYTDSVAERMTIEKHTSHQWNSGKVTKAATCTAKGTKKYTCQICGATKTSSIKALGHNHESWSVEKRATISADGLKTAKCTRCGAKSSATIPEVGTIKLSKTKYTYNGKVKNPTVTIKDDKGNTISSKNYTITKQTKRKNVGKHSYKVTFKNQYKGSKTLNFTIRPAATSMTSRPVGAKKAFTVKWKKISVQATGYEIKYSTSKKFTSKTTKVATVKSYKTTSKTIKNLKAKQLYYVKVRTYKVVDGTKYYSIWSAIKTVQTK